MVLKALEKQKKGHHEGNTVDVQVARCGTGDEDEGGTVHTVKDDGHCSRDDLTGGGADD